MIKKVYLFGDSICFGQLVSGHKTWANALARSLEDLKTSNVDFLVQNAGVNGNTTRLALERLYHDVLSHRPNYVIVQFGMNDCNFWASDGTSPRVSQAAFKANLIEIVEKCFSLGIQHCFINTNHPSQKGSFAHTDLTTYDKSNALYNKLIREAYWQLHNDKHKVTLIDIEKIWFEFLEAETNIELKNLLLPDGVHLSEMGHRLYEETVVDTLIKEISGAEKL
jgi:lysophospholipase L1-like esterase